MKLRCLVSLIFGWVAEDLLKRERTKRNIMKLTGRTIRIPEDPQASDLPSY